MENAAIIDIDAPEEEAGDLKATICELLRWSELRYADHQYEAGIAYLEHYIPTDKHGIDMLIRERLFWNWWKNHWMFRDKAFADQLDLKKVDLDTRIEIYKGLHDPKTLVAEIYPNSVVLGNTYAQMINEIHDLNLKQ